MGAGLQACPAGKPSATDSCTPSMGNCKYADEMCDCVQGMNTWACWSPADCPASVPAEMSACPTTGMSCTVAGAGCTCTADGWNCGNQYCPAEEPAAAAECEG
ncbi:MAG TPA: hypothetical protein VFG30_20240, partial [Polyangiales bacterium]|nr:hypothetical protein [Polyangiales bacterium]